MNPRASTKKYIFAVGRRKQATASVKLFTGKSASLVNGIAAETYFPLGSRQQDYQQPFEVSQTAGKYYFQARINGGGKKGQAEALKLALSRALQQLNPDLRPGLKNAGLLTVDSRVKQRRMVGTGGKARRQKQSPKR